MSTMSTRRSEFDPYGVPAEPVVTIDFQIGTDGTERALVDRSAVSPRPGESPRSAALRQVAELLESGGTDDADGIRVRFNAPDLRGYEAVIDRQGRLFVPVDTATTPRRPEPGSLVALAQEAFDRADLHDRAPREQARREPWQQAPPKPPEEAWSPTFLDARPQLPEVREILPVTDVAQGTAPAEPPTLDAPAAPSVDPSVTSSADARSDAGDEHPDARLRALLGGDALRDDERDDERDEALDDTRDTAADEAGDEPPLAALRPPVDPEPTRPPRRLRLRPAVVAVIVAALLAAGGLAAIVAGLASSRTGLLSPETPGTSSGASAALRPFPGTPPAGFGAAPRWISEPVQTGRVVAVGDAIAYLTTTGRLTVVDAMTGAKRWSVPLPSGGTTTPPARTTIDGQEVLATQVGATLAWWRLTDGRAAGTLELPAQARATFLGEAPLVGLDSHTVGIVSRGELRRVAVPAGAYPLAAKTTGRVTAASSRGWWHLHPGRAPGAVHPWEDAAGQEQAPGAAPGVVGYLRSSVLLLYPADRTGALHVVAHTDREEDVRMSFRGRVAAVSEVTQPWWPAPSGTWGVLGRTLVDVKAGKVSDLGDWRTTWITADRAYGTVAGQPSQVDAGAAGTVGAAETGDAGAVGASPQGATIPEVVTPAGAAVRARGPGGESLYLLPPD